MKTACSTCEAPCLWANTEKGSHMLLDFEPHEKGNIVYVPPRPGIPARCWVATKKRPAPAGTPLYRSHFVTCPHAEQHRRR